MSEDLFKHAASLEGVPMGAAARGAEPHDCRTVQTADEPGNP